MAGLDAGTLASIATALAVLVAVVFGIVQYRQAERKRRDEAALDVLRTLQTPEFTRALRAVMMLPTDAAPERIAADAALVEAAELVGTTFETLGVGVYRRLVPLEVVQDALGTGIVIAWNHLAGHVGQYREMTGAPSVYEWFQWLAERLAEEKPAYKAVGAYVALRDWKP